MLPCLLSIPHGGTLIPEEVKDLILLSPEDIIEDGDPFTSELYDIKAVSLLKAKVARAIVDLNRAPDDLPPKNPDGVVKSETAFGKRVYRRFPDKELVKKLLEKYYFPYHRKIQEEAKRNDILIAFDCHSMAPEAPKIAPDVGRRPAVCLGDFHGKACPREITELLASCFREVFRLPEEGVRINEPFAGGYITRTYGMRTKPWIQIEIRRDLYMDWEKRKKDPEKLLQVRKKIGEALSLFFERATL